MCGRVLGAMPRASRYLRRGYTFHLTHRCHWSSRDRQPIAKGGQEGDWKPLTLALSLPSAGSGQARGEGMEFGGREWIQESEFRIQNKYIAIGHGGAKMLPAFLLISES